MRFVRRPDEPAAPADGEAAASAGDWGKWYPALTEYLVSLVWPDGQARVTSTLLLLFEEGLWKACVNDRANDRSLWLSGRTPDAVLERVEEALAGGLCDWRRRRGGERGRRG